MRRRVCRIDQDLLIRRTAAWANSLAKRVPAHGRRVPRCSQRSRDGRLARAPRGDEGRGSTKRLGCRHLRLTDAGLTGRGPRNCSPSRTGRVSKGESSSTLVSAKRIPMVEELMTFL